MLLIGVLAACGALLSSKTLRDIVPFESLLAVSFAAIICVALFQMEKIG